MKLFTGLLMAITVGLAPATGFTQDDQTSTK